MTDIRLHGPQKVFVLVETRFLNYSGLDCPVVSVFRTKELAQERMAKLIKENRESRRGLFYDFTDREWEAYVRVTETDTQYRAKDENSDRMMECNIFEEEVKEIDRETEDCERCEQSPCQCDAES